MICVIIFKKKQLLLTVSLGGCTFVDGDDHGNLILINILKIYHIPCTISIKYIVHLNQFAV